MNIENHNGNPNKENSWEPKVKNLAALVSLLGREDDAMILHVFASSDKTSGAFTILREEHGALRLADAVQAAWNRMLCEMVVKGGMTPQELLARAGGALAFCGRTEEAIGFMASAAIITEGNG